MAATMGCVLDLVFKARRGYENHQNLWFIYPVKTSQLDKKNLSSTSFYEKLPMIQKLLYLKGMTNLTEKFIYFLSTKKNAKINAHFKEPIFLL